MSTLVVGFLAFWWMDAHIVHAFDFEIYQHGSGAMRQFCGWMLTSPRRQTFWGLVLTPSNLVEIARVGNDAHIILVGDL